MTTAAWAVVIAALGLILALIAHLVVVAHSMGGIGTLVKIHDEEWRSLRKARHVHANRIKGHEGQINTLEEKVEELREEVVEFRGGMAALGRIEDKLNGERTTRNQGRDA